MKKIFYFILIILFSPLPISAETNRTISLKFNKSDFEMTEQDSMLYISTPKYTTVLRTDTMAPALPFICLNILIGENEIYDSFSSVQKESLLFENIDMAPTPAITTTNSLKLKTALKKAPYPKTCYPDERIEYTGTHNMGGFRYITFLVCPFRYEAGSKELFISTQLDLDINFSTQTKDLHVTDQMVNIDLEESVKDLVFNPQDMDVFYKEAFTKAKAGFSPKSTNSGESYDYLIITCDSLKSEFQRLADWKTIKGLRAKVVSVEDIYNSNQSDKPLKIKEKIKYYYTNSTSPHKLKYVLLGGGNSIVPSRQCYIQITTKDGILQKTTPADIYYACLEHLNWDTDSDSYHGTLGDCISLSPWVTVSRLPAENSQDARNMVDRILKYERNPLTTNWKNQMLKCGVKRSNYCTYNGVTVSDSHKASELMYAAYIANTGWTGNKYRFYDTGTENGSNYNVTSTNLQSELSKGYAFASVTSHGADISWSMESGSDYSNYKASNLSNPRYTVITTGACDTNAFDSIASLGYSFMKNENGGIISYYGSSRENIYYSNGLIGPAEKYEGKLFSKLFTGTKRFAAAVNASKNEFTSSLNSYNDNRWLHLSLNALCDPEMGIYTDTPTTFQTVNCSHTNNQFTMTSYYESFDICVMSRLDNGASYYNCYPSYDSSPFTTNVTGESLICISYPGVIPIWTIFGASVYLQNESLCDNLGVMADNVHIGRNVVGGRTQGPVTIENGRSTISSTNGVTISNDFKVKSGASLKITTN